MRESYNKTEERQLLAFVPELGIFFDQAANGEKKIYR